MAKNIVSKKFVRGATTTEEFTVPAGVTQITAFFKEKFDHETNSFAPMQEIDQFGQIWSWGPQPIGDGSILNRLSPTALNTFIGTPMKAPWLRADGQMVNWGNNTYGQLGDGTTIQKSTPTLVSGGYRFKKVVRGTTCAGLTEDGDLYAWGRNAHGQLGDGTVNDASSPVQVMPGTKFEDFWVDKGTNFYTSFGFNTIFAKTADGSLYAWGRDGGAQGQLGTSSVGSLSTPTLVSSALDFVKISLSSLVGLGGATLGLTRDGNAYAWGRNSSGQLGDNTIVSKSTPTLVIGGYKFKDIGMGTDSAFGLARNGNLYTWGDNSQGQLGHGGIFPRSSPTQVTGMGQTLKKAYLNNQSMYAIDQLGRTYAWGFQETLYPVLGIGTNNKVSAPTLLTTIGFSSIVDEIIAENGESVHAITKYGSRYSWGDNLGGQMGNNSVTARFNAPQLVIGPNFTGQIDSPSGNIFHKLPETKVVRHILDVEPGQVITVGYDLGQISLPDFNLFSSQFCRELELQWVG